MRALQLVGGIAIAFAITLLSRPASGLSPEEAANYCYDQAKKMGFSSREMENRSWEDCLSQFRRPAQAAPAAPVPAVSPQERAPAPPPAPGFSPQERAVILQYLLNQQNAAPPANPGLEFSKGVLRSLCNSEGGYVTPDGQCMKPPSPPRPPSYQCWQIGNSTNCTPY